MTQDNRPIVDAAVAVAAFDAAHECGLLDALERHQPSSAAELAARCHLDGHAVALVLAALARLGVVSLGGRPVGDGEPEEDTYLLIERIDEKTVSEELRNRIATFLDGRRHRSGADNDETIAIAPLLQRISSGFGAPIRTGTSEHGPGRRAATDRPGLSTAEG